MNISLRNLKLINVIVKEGSITRASEKLFLTQPALSHQLKKLEEEIGLKIFNRLNKKLILTDIGRVLYSNSEKILASINLLNLELDEIKKGNKKEIRLTTECYTCYHWLPRVVQEFRKENPAINVQINIEATKEPIQYLLEGKIDLAIVSNKTNHPSIRLEPLVTDEMVLILSKINPLNILEKINLIDLINQNLILYDIPEKKNYVLTNILHNNIGLVNSIQKVQLTEAIIELVSANLGVSIMAKWAVIPFLKNKNLEIIPFDSILGKRDWYVASLNNISKIENLFINEIKKEFKE
ncbi:LysR family transcriptional regulator [Tenacibaculum finnmarkense genomovar finnmarkense]|nr:LysR family transcriptional regulator [Tenacibaculum finnmarkense]MCD8416958.1 LysR family transcriptional regulator [Tenacibaculum finnmarkense genomovar finnmarkense]MCG8185403.1 LysR family transcriptional regulator [Tenacibaculum finnmarkense genomovar finnmarkense]MCG8201787.1 LysR family transcriptional regulator [Tenacibaculum finnmarkense genomovar finnmarkense]MCG8209464.1 LysR family transcriptional regulator [Tenacibaculum finnmarkense genomovar finnmarkense]MCG8212260.1 LysR fam